MTHLTFHIPSAQGHDDVRVFVCSAALHQFVTCSFAEKAADEFPGNFAHPAVQPRFRLLEIPGVESLL